MKNTLSMVCMLAGALLAGGCATKKYVRNTTAPVQAKVDQVAEQTTKHGQAIEENRSQIKQVDERAEAGISAAKEKAMTADTHAGEAMERANQAKTAADQNNREIGSLRQVVNNLDDYKLQSEVIIPFGFNKYQLTEESKQKLDQLVTQKGQMKRYYIAVEGFTDKTGPLAYNEALSRKRADAVVEYLVAKHDLPVYRIHMVGLGPQKPADESNNREARAKNRRVEVRIFSADTNATVSQLK